MRARLSLLTLLALLAGCGASGSTSDATDDATDDANDATRDACSVACGDDPCVVWRVDEACACVVDRYAEGAACDDGDPCTDGDACRADGSCGGAAVAVDDGLDCTDDACSPADGVTHQPRGGFCVIDGACHDDGGSVPQPRTATQLSPSPSITCVAKRRRNSGEATGVVRSIVNPSPAQ